MESEDFRPQSISLLRAALLSPNCGRQALYELRSQVTPDAASFTALFVSKRVVAIREPSRQPLYPTAMSSWWRRALSGHPPERRGPARHPEEESWN